MCVFYTLFWLSELGVFEGFCAHITITNGLLPILLGQKSD